MSLAGDRLRALAARICGPATMERLIDPVIADLQCEHADAMRRGQLWRAVWIRFAGVWAFCRVMTAVVLSAPHAWAAADDWALGRTLALVTAVTAGVVLLFNLSYLTGALSPLRAAEAIRAFAYLVPAAFPLAVSAGVLFGVAFGLRGRTITDRLRRATLVIGIGSALAALVTLGWIAPVSNQAFRSTASGIPYDKLAKGTNELTLPELRAKRMALDAGPMRDSVQARDAAFNYQARLSFTVTPVVLALLALALADRRRNAGRMAIGAWAFASCVIFWVMLMGSREAIMLGGVPAVIVWIPNLFGVAGTYWLRSRRVAMSSNS